MKAKVYVPLKKGVLDPQGKAVMSALQSTGFDEVTDVRIGKFMELEIKDGQKDAEEARLKQMCEKLLANTVIENYRIELE